MLLQLEPHLLRGPVAIAVSDYLDFSCCHEIGVGSASLIANDDCGQMLTAKVGGSSCGNNSECITFATAICEGYMDQKIQTYCGETRSNDFSLWQELTGRCYKTVTKNMPSTN
eukprot:scaffold8876_cov108-Skeletonema_marinoi.AAC.6